ncbi:MAG: hypothetical protein K2X35_02260 [Bryobacteraceae bacterium]|nr:hypothetical protein [Bryobacteraceae bacterium]
MTRLVAETTRFEHWPDCVRIENGVVDLVVPRGFGPRVMRFGFVNGPNLFKIFAPDPPEAPAARIRGGHRLWVAPEIPDITWVNDTAPVQVDVQADSVVATGTLEPASGLVKQMTIAMRGAAVGIRHQVTNSGPSSMLLAPWALTQMAPGGWGISAFPPKGEHPRDLLPNGALILWPYTDLTDPRWRLLRKYYALQQDPERGPNKAGGFLEQTWGAYLLADHLFIKRSTGVSGATYPDMGCSFEVFTNQHMLELETLGPLVTLAPGESVTHEERWSLHRGVALAEWTDEELDRVIAPLL